MPSFPAQLDHLVLATPDLAAGIAAVEEHLGVPCLPGGAHPAWGTRNALVPLGPTSYLEVIGPDPERLPGPLPELFGIHILDGPRLVTWAAKGAHLSRLVGDARAHGIDLGAVLPGSRVRPDGVTLTWELTDPLQSRAGGVLPFFIDWGTSPHPATAGPAGVQLLGFSAEHPEPAVVAAPLGKLGLCLDLAHGPRPALCAVLQTTRGEVVLS
ncbi:MAG: VOC family protein [Candidatus Latescibacteria bacterium]|nr:VOC family protein [Candidatus Latescibacterota bacterium]